MPILSAEIPQNPLPYQRDNFMYAEVMDEATTDLQELPADPIVEDGLLPHLVAEYHFTRFQTPLLNIGLVRFHQKLDMRMFKFRGRHQNSWKATSKLEGFQPSKVLNCAKRTAWSIHSRYDHARPE